MCLYTVNAILGQLSANFTMYYNLARKPHKPLKLDPHDHFPNRSPTHPKWLLDNSKYMYLRFFFVSEFLSIILLFLVLLYSTCTFKFVPHLCACANKWKSFEWPLRLDATTMTGYSALFVSHPIFRSAQRMALLLKGKVWMPSHVLIMNDVS